MEGISLLTSLIQTGQNEELAIQLNRSPELGNQNTEQGISLLQFAAYCRNHKAIEILKKYKSQLNLFEASSLGDLDSIKSILRSDRTLINSYSPDGFTALGLACFFGHYEVAVFLLSNDADANIASANSFKVSPLHSACAISNLEIAKLIIQNGADVNARQQQGVTPLHSAAHNGQIEMVKLLIQNGADTTAQMDNGKTPEDMALEKGYSDIATIIHKLTMK
ncbi:MAG: ankyrin repeat domain-containing protein [Saprospiraceae bacterium]|nr:ankyrin repeat domain-containing protein [Saprospiraceae bacterium]